MADYSSGIVEAPVNLPGVSDLIEAGTYEEGEVCVSTKINKFSPYKPINYDKITPLTETEWLSAHYGVSIRSIQPTYRKAAIMAIKGYDPETVYAETQQNVPLTDLLVYDRPSGGKTSPFRLSDFEKYNHNAEQSIWGVEIDNTHYRFYQYEGGYDASMFGTDVTGNGKYVHIGMLIVMWDGTEAEGMPVPSKIFIVSGGVHIDGKDDTTFDFYQMGNNIMSINGSAVFPVSETIPTAFVLPVLFKEDSDKSITGVYGVVRDETTGVETATTPIEVAEYDSLGNNKWDEAQTDFIVIPLQSVKFEYSKPAPVYTASLAWGTIGTELGNLVINLVYSGNSNVDSYVVTLTYNCRNTETPTVVRPPIKGENINKSFQLMDYYLDINDVDNVDIECTYTYNGTSITLEKQNVENLS